MKIISLFTVLLVLVSNVFANSTTEIIAKSDVVWIKPAANSFKAKLNQTMEIGMNFGNVIDTKIRNYVNSVKGADLNPFDPEYVDVKAVLMSPSGKVKHGIAFYFQDFTENLSADLFQEKFTEHPWRLRFAPTEIGQWKVEIEASVKGEVKPIIYTLQFNCEASEHKGAIAPIHTGTDKDRFLYYKQSGERFITNGMNVSSGGFTTYKPSQNRRQMGGVEKLAAANGNFIRFEIGAQGALPDWYNLFNYQNKQDEMYGFDRLVQTAEDHQIYAIFFRHHVEILGADWDVPNWQNNPYRQHFNFEKISEYFTNPEAIKLQKNNLRYMYARWGYSPYWSFYGSSELEKFFDPIIEQEGISDEEAIQIFKKWFLDQKNYILTELNPDALFANSYGTMKKAESRKDYDGMLNASDVTAIHIYSTIKDMNYVNRAEAVDKYWSYYHQPVILEEIGLNDDKLALNCCTGIDFHNSLWSTAFMGSTGPGLDWWWDRGIMDFDYERDLIPLQNFITPLTDSAKTFIPYRWADGKDNSRLIETYALISEDKQEIHGWLHNASYYWRNDINSTCIQSLLDSSNLATDCIVGDKITVGRNETPRDYAHDRHSDKYTSRGGFQPFTGGIENNPIFKVDDVEKGRGKNRVWYKVQFFSTRADGNLETIPLSGQVVRAGFGKTLKIAAPNLDDKHPDVAYRITVIGKGKKRPVRVIITPSF